MVCPGPLLYRMIVGDRDAMGYAELIEKLKALPQDMQSEVFDFVDFLAARQSPGWTDRDFAELSAEQALRGFEDEPAIYTRDDLREVWK